jgi:hypothetical protein
MLHGHAWRIDLTIGGRSSSGDIEGREQQHDRPHLERRRPHRVRRDAWQPRRTDLRLDEDGRTECITLYLGDSRESVQGFAGEDDRLVEREHTVKHYEIVYSVEPD